MPSLRRFFRINELTSGLDLFNFNGTFRNARLAHCWLIVFQKVSSNDGRIVVISLLFHFVWSRLFETISGSYSDGILIGYSCDFFPRV